MANDSPPDEANLYQAAVNHLARYAATEVGLRRVLLRRIDRWARAQPDAEAAEPAATAAREGVDGIVRRLADTGVLSDTAFAESRARGLVRSGQSTRSIHMRLVAKGVPPDVARSAAAVDPTTELAAALVLSRKRRIGPYRVTDDADNAVRMKEMGLLARAGFSRDTAEQALRTSREDADALIFELRR